MTDKLIRKSDEPGGNTGAVSDATIRLFDEARNEIMESTLKGKAMISVGEDPVTKNLKQTLIWWDTGDKYHQAWLDPKQTYEIKGKMAGCSGSLNDVMLIDSVEGKPIVDSKSQGPVTFIEKSPIANGFFNSGETRTTNQFRAAWWCDDKNQFVQRSLTPSDVLFVSNDKDKAGSHRKL